MTTPDPTRSKAIEVIFTAIDEQFGEVISQPGIKEIAALALTAYESHLQAEGMAVVPGWQPIESAPKDGTRILVWIAPGYITVGYWLTDSHKDRPKPFWGHELCGSIASRARKYPPTHWQPLPASPSIKAGKEESK